MSQDTIVYMYGWDNLNMATHCAGRVMLLDGGLSTDVSVSS